MRSSFGPSGPNEFGYSASSRSTGGGYPVGRGAVAEWLGRGLQSLVHRFESGRRLCRCAQWTVTSTVPAPLASRPPRPSALATILWTPRCDTLGSVPRAMHCVLALHLLGASVQLSRHSPRPSSWPSESHTSALTEIMCPT